MNVTENPFHTFIELIKVDQAIVTFKHAIEKLHAEINDLKAQEEKLAAVVASAKIQMQEARKVVDAHELELKALDQQEKQKKERLENATDYKQYQSLKSEIDTLKHRQHDYEEILMVAWNKLEATQKEYEQAQADYPAKGEAIIAQIQKKETEIAVLQAQLDEQNEQRAGKEKPVPTEWLDKYAMMRERVSDPVVPVQQGSCSACYYKVPEQDLIMLRRRKLLQCKSCYRLLYSAEFEQDGSLEAS